MVNSSQSITGFAEPIEKKGSEIGAEGTKDFQSIRRSATPSSLQQGNRDRISAHVVTVFQELVEKGDHSLKARSYLNRLLGFTLTDSDGIDLLNVTSLRVRAKYSWRTG